MRFSAAFCMSHVQVYVGALLVFHLLMDIAVNVSFSPIALSTSRKEVHKLEGIQKLKNFFLKRGAVFHG